MNSEIIPTTESTALVSRSEQDLINELNMAYSGETYHGNALLTGKNVIVNLSKEANEYRVNEIIKCMNDPTYFAEKYYTIVSPSAGKHIIEMYPKQEELISEMFRCRRLVTCASRQSGKCFSLSTSLTIRCIETGKIETITAGEFKERLNKRFLLSRLSVVNFINKTIKQLYKGISKLWKRK